MTNETINFEIETTVTAINKTCNVEYREVKILVAAEQGFTSHEETALFQRQFFKVMHCSCPNYATKGKAMNAARAMARGNQFEHRSGLVVVKMFSDLEGEAWWVGGVEGLEGRLFDPFENR